MALGAEERVEAGGARVWEGRRAASMGRGIGSSSEAERSVGRGGGRSAEQGSHEELLERGGR